MESSNCIFRQFPDCVERVFHTDFGENVQRMCLDCVESGQSICEKCPDSIDKVF